MTVAFNVQRAVEEIRPHLDFRSTAQRRADEQRAAYVAGCQRVGPKVYQVPNLVRGPRSGAVFLGSALPVIPRDVVGRVTTLDGIEFSWVRDAGPHALSFVVPPGTLVEVTRS